MLSLISVEEEAFNGLPPRRAWQQAGRPGICCWHDPKRASLWAGRGEAVTLRPVTDRPDSLTPQADQARHAHPLFPLLHLSLLVMPRRGKQAWSGDRTGLTWDQADYLNLSGDPSHMVVWSPPRSCGAGLCCRHLLGRPCLPPRSCGGRSLIPSQCNDSGGCSSTWAGGGLLPATSEKLFAHLSNM